mgnify:CR=1 FL=1
MRMINPGANPVSPALAPRPMAGAPARGNQLAPANMPQMPMGGGRPPSVMQAGLAPMAPPVRTGAAMVPGSQIMPQGRAFKRGGMVGCDWSPKSSTTMRGAARKGK